ncbi:hypothetical protein [Pseudonocardia pini]|uniref:hypothetical protein n=1 Tax=Pseudonocardia pini TaxID=2758030 RepID=UPI0015F0BAC2|nr:hypothetical protein [Pseudonocardia pini]
MTAPDGQSNASRGLRAQLTDAVARKRATVDVDAIHLESLLNERDRLAADLGLLQARDVAGQAWMERLTCQRDAAVEGHRALLIELTKAQAERDRLRAIEQRARDLAETTVRDLGDWPLIARHILTGERPT